MYILFTKVTRIAIMSKIMSIHMMNERLSKLPCKMMCWNAKVESII